MRDSENGKGIEHIIGKGKSLAEFMNHTRDVSMRLHYINNKIKDNMDHIRFWKTDYYDSYKAKYKLSNEDASFNISHYILNNFTNQKVYK